jgi:multiple sugar transport system permease protein
MSEQEINYSYFDPLIGAHGGNGDTGISYRVIRLIPDITTINQYYRVLIQKPQYHFLFWNSVRVVVPIVAGQIAVASMAAYAFAKIPFKGRNSLFFVYIIVMMMPFQVTLVPNYIIAGFLGLIDNFLSIILPGIFSAFGVFLLRQYMISIPDAYCESAHVDGANPFQIFLKIVLPMSKAGIASLAILIFIDNWNMVEQPLIFLKSHTRNMLSVFLSTINSNERGIAFAASSIYMAPMLLVFLYGENYLVDGIRLSGLKG